jgi:hypothetical protein
MVPGELGGAVRIDRRRTGETRRHASPDAQVHRYRPLRRTVFDELLGGPITGFATLAPRFLAECRIGARQFAQRIRLEQDGGEIIFKVRLQPIACRAALGDEVPRAIEGSLGHKAPAHDVLLCERCGSQGLPAVKAGLVLEKGCLVTGSFGQGGRARGMRHVTLLALARPKTGPRKIRSWVLW